MRLGVRPVGAGAPRVPAMFVGIAEGDMLETLKLPVAHRRPVRAALAARDTVGRKNKITVVYAGSTRLLLAGLGPRKAVSAEVLREAAAVAARQAQGLKVRDLAVWLPALAPRFGTAAAVAAVADGLNQGGYAYNAYRTRTEDRATQLESVVFLSPRAELAEAKAAVGGLGVVLDAVNFARDLANRPGNDLVPRTLAEAAQAMARTHGLRCRVHGPKELERLGAGGLLGVSRGSAEEPRLVELDYTPRGRARGTLVFVGKGLTFDSGGISLKPADNMDRMKFDMCGAAAVVGALQAIAQLKPAVRVVGLVGATENLPGGKALKPGDVLTALSGTTIEIINTDAEGRLVLADALNYATRFKPDAVVDLATLTGACIIALGTFTAGLFASDEKVCERLLESSRRTGERMWRLPLWPQYEEMMKSDIADLKNATAVREAGACTAAAFLKRFTGYPWAHLDIAGVGHLDRERPDLARGGTGFGVKSLVDFATHWE
ncbi:MAG TPA: leucyl aminopeptidase [Candidatus Saccharimonadales bacterium]|nr:leucyl aminopeptidase [Candidatus Saccharimonadales bacterium]